MRGKATSDEVKAEVVAALMAGLGVNDAARKFNLPPPTISRIKAELGTELEQVGIEKRERIDDLLLSCMATNLSALERIAIASSDAHYLKNQAAGGIAELYREIASVTVRLLEAASAAGVGEGEPIEPE